MKTVPCPECGNEISPEKDFCNRCYADDVEAVKLPDTVDLDVCTNCGSYDLGDGWTSHEEAVPEAELVMDAVDRVLHAHVDARDPSVSVAARRRDPNTYVVEVDFEANVRGHLVEETLSVEASVNRTTCTTCSRRSGGYYESIVQVRASGRQPSEDEIERAKELAYDVAGRDLGDRDTFVTETQEVQGGLDVYMSTTKSGRQVAEALAEEYGGEVGDSATLVGEKEGDEIYRVTFAVELPEYVAGDVVEVDDDVVLVESTDRMLRGTSLETGDRRRCPRDEVDDARKLATVEESLETTVVSHDDEEIQVLDPKTYETVTLQRPSYVPRSAESVYALSTSEGLYLLPRGRSSKPRDARNKKP